jgi:hypothetical protein
MTRRAPFFVLALVLASCGAKTSYLKDAKRTLQVAYDVTKTADSTFSAWSAGHQAQIVATSTSREQAEKNLADFRARRQSVLKAFAVAYTAIGSVAAAIPLVERGVRKDADLIPLLFDVLKAANDVKEAIKAFQEATR